MCEYFSLKVFSKNVKSECKLSVISFSSKQSLRKTFIRLRYVRIFQRSLFIVYFCTDCYGLSQFVFLPKIYLKFVLCSV